MAPADQQQHEREAGRGLSAAFAAFAIWGLLPLYLRPLQHVPALEIMATRLVFCCAVVLSILALRGELEHVRVALRDPTTRLRLSATAVFISINWLVYVWSVTHGHVVEASLGYFINPLVSVLLGVVVLGERLNRAQGIAVALAALGVCHLTWVLGRPPWIALVLATSFGLYGLLRKVVATPALAGLAAETLLIAPFGLAYLLWLELTGAGALGDAGPLITALLVGGGPLTALPLALFAYGARRIRLATVGLLQYVAPSMQLLIGVFVYREPFSSGRLLGFSMIWLALLLYAADGLWRTRPSRAKKRAAELNERRIALK